MGTGVSVFEFTAVVFMLIFLMLDSHFGVFLKTKRASKRVSD